MKIIVHSFNDHRLCIPLPTSLLTSPTAVRFALNIGKRHTDTSMPNIPPEVVQALCQSIRRIKKQYGQWELVHVESADGDLVCIIL